METCPTYLFFDESDFLRLGPVLKSGPPVRFRSEVERLWQRVLAGQVDVIGSDHSPSTWDLKATASGYLESLGRDVRRADDAARAA